LQLKPWQTEWSKLKIRVSRTEDKEEKLAQTLKDHEKMLREYKGNMQAIWDTMKRPNF
jgi:septal ring factor EnvC (AmiA/AmiB activator)